MLSDLAKLEAALPPPFRREPARVLGYREFCESPEFLNLTLSPLVAAIQDASEGLPVTSIDDEMCIRHFGCSRDGLPRQKRRMLTVRAGGRGGKTSRLLATKAIHAAWTVPVPVLNPGEKASSLLIAPDMKLAKQALSFVHGYVEESETLRSALVKEPTAENIQLRRPDGKVVSIVVLAASRGGRATRGRSLVFVGMDEAAFFYAEGTGVINDGEILSAVSMRVVEGGQIFIVSTPWLVDVGVLEKNLKRDLGKHEQGLACKAPTRALNPNWDPTGEIERTERQEDPDKARREIDAEPIASGEFSFFEPASIDAAVDKTLCLPRKANPGEEVSAGGDFGFRSDAAAMCVSHRAWVQVDGKSVNMCIVADLLELTPQGTPLRPSAVVRQFSERLQVHAGLEYLVADGHYRESVSEHLAENNLGFVLAPAGAEGVAKVFMRARGLFREGRVRIPDHPRLIQQLKAIRWQALAGGGVAIIKPRVTARADRGGSHCDLADAFVLSIWELGGLEVPEAPRASGSHEALMAEQEAIKAQLEAELAERMRERAEESQEYWA